MEKAGIIGGGSIGLMLAFYLKKAGFDVTIYTKTEVQATSIKQDGVTLQRGGNVMTVSVDSLPFEKMEQLTDHYLFLTVKQYHLKEITDRLLQKQGSVQALIFMQNGMSHLNDLEMLQGKADNIYVGIIEHGALKQSVTKIEHTGMGELKIGCVYQEREHPTRLWMKLTEEGFLSAFYDNWFEIMVKKLMVNALINPLTAVYKVENGVLLSNQYYFEILRKLFDEISLVYECTESDWLSIQDICLKTSRNRSSMLKDIEEGRKTEIEAITGVVLKRALDKKISLPYHLFLYNSIKGMELQREEESK